MQSLAAWRIRRLYESEAPAPEEEPATSTAPSLNNGGLPSEQPKPTFQELLKKWRSERKQTPDFSSTKGLGERGMGYIGSSTFERNPVQAGETPTISHGIPVGDPVGMFGN